MSRSLKVFILLLILSITSAFAGDWRDSFYTDDSSYYLKLSSDGFTQRVQVSASDCHQIEQIDVIFKSNPSTPKARLDRVSRRTQAWQKIYGLDEGAYCWFQGSVHGLDLNKPSQNHYVLRIKATTSSQPYYFVRAGDSLLPKNRLLQNPQSTPWMSLGPQGASAVEGGGIFYKVWEPVADEVHLFIGDSKEAIRMSPDSELRDQYLSHVTYLPLSKVGDSYVYKYLKNGSYEALYVSNSATMSEDKIDPMARKLVYDAKGGYHNGYVNAKAIATAESSYLWKNDAFGSNTSNADLITYQIFPLTFNPKKVSGAYTQGRFRDIEEKIDYITDLGVNAIEFMPINEARYEASWGYSLDSLTLIEKNLGSTDELRSLVDGFHKNSIKVIFDIVINHINNALLREPLSASVNKSKFYKGDTGWGPKPDFSKPMVRKWIMDSLLSLIRDYHLDGFRFDMIEYVYKNDADGWRFIQEMNTLLKTLYPHFYLAAEQLPNNVWMTFPQTDGGAGFDTQWNDLFKNFFEQSFDYYRENNRRVNPAPLLGSLLGYSDHMDYSGRAYAFGSPKRTVNYLASHDFIGNKDPILRIVSDYEEFESDGSNTFFKVRPPRDNAYSFRQIHNNFTHSVARMAYGILFTKPGDLLFYQGEELANDLNIENEWSYVDAKTGFPSKAIDVNRYIGSHRMVWEFLNPGTNDSTLSYLTPAEKNLFTGHRQFIKDLISFRKNNPQISAQEAYNTRLSYNDSVLSYQVGNPNGGEYFVIINFGDRKDGAWISFPGDANSWWKELINSSATIYGGANDSALNVIDNVGGRSNNVRLEASSIIIFQKKTQGNINTALYLRGSISGWQALEQNLLRKNAQTPEIYSTELDIIEDGTQEFKLGTKDWQIEMGLGSNSGYSTMDPSPRGYLSILPNQPNIKVGLRRGHYRFTFNVRTFEFSFTPLQ